MIILQGSTEYERLQVIKKSLSEDGLELADEQKILLHVWDKLQRTEDALKAQAKEASHLIPPPLFHIVYQQLYLLQRFFVFLNIHVHILLQNQKLKKQQKDEMESFGRGLSEIRALSSEKDKHIQDLSTENNNLRGMAEKVTVERDAFLSENEAVVRLLMDHGVHQSLNNSKKSATLQSSVEQLVNEREQQQSSIERLRAENVRLVMDVRKRKESIENERKFLQTKVPNTTPLSGNVLTCIKIIL